MRSVLSKPMPAFRSECAIREAVIVPSTAARPPVPMPSLISAKYRPLPSVNEAAQSPQSEAPPRRVLRKAALYRIHRLLAHLQQCARRPPPHRLGEGAPAGREISRVSCPLLMCTPRGASRAPHGHAAGICRCGSKPQSASARGGAPRAPARRSPRRSAGTARILPPYPRASARLSKCSSTTARTCSARILALSFASSSLYSPFTASRISPARPQRVETARRNRCGPRARARAAGSSAAKSSSASRPCFCASTRRTGCTRQTFFRRAPIHARQVVRRRILQFFRDLIDGFRCAAHRVRHSAAAESRFSQRIARQLVPAHGEKV